MDTPLATSPVPRHARCFLACHCRRLGAVRAPARRRARSSSTSSRVSSPSSSQDYLSHYVGRSDGAAGQRQGLGQGVGSTPRRTKRAPPAPARSVGQSPRFPLYSFLSVELTEGGLSSLISGTRGSCVVGREGTPSRPHARRTRPASLLCIAQPQDKHLWGAVGLFVLCWFIQINHFRLKIL